MSTVKEKQGAYLSSVNGPVCHARNIEGFHLRDMVLAGEKKLIGEVIALDQDDATLQIYEAVSYTHLTLPTSELV